MKLRHIGSLTLPFLIVLALFTPLSAADSKLTVVVKKESGEPASSVIVHAYDLKAGTQLEQKTNKRGEAVFKKVQGVYRIVVKTEGYDPAMIEYLLVGAGEQKTAEITLKAGDFTKKLFYEDPTTEQKLSTLSNEAKQFLQENKGAEAEAKLREALAINPFMPQFRQSLAVALIGQKKWDEAQQELQTALDEIGILKQVAADPAWYEQLERGIKGLVDKLPLLRIQVEADDDVRAGRFDQAIAKYQEFLKVAPPNEEGVPGVMYNLALTYARAGRYDEARKVIDQAVALDPGDQNAQQLKKILYENEKQIAVNQAIQRIKAGAEAMGQGKYEEALKIYQETLASAPNEATQRDSWLGLARTYQKLGREPEMIEAYKKTIALSKDKPPVAQELAQYLFSKDRPAEAIQALTDTYKMIGKPADGELFNLAMAYNTKAATKKYAPALFQEVLKLNPDYAEALYELGMIYNYDLNDPAKARAMLTKYTQIGKDEAHVGNAKAVLIALEKAEPAAKPKAPAKK
jgi:tetratricopeptide (TPR) repeat protein